MVAPIAGARGIARLEPRQVTVKFYGDDVRVPVSSLNREWGYKVYAKVVDIAVRSQIVELMPWERWMFFGNGQEPLELPLETRPSDDELAKIDGVRRVALDYLGDKGNSHVHADAEAHLGESGSPQGSLR